MRYTASVFFQRAIAELNQIDVLAHRSFDTHDAATLNRHPRPSAWSAVQCFEHLAKINRVYLKAVDHALQYARTAPLDATATFSHTIFERYFIWTLEPPARIKLPTIKAVAAGEGWIDPVSVRTAYFATHTAFRDTLERARRVNIKRTKVISPIAAWLRWSVAAAVDVMLAHERRHLWQAERAMGSVKG